MRAMFPRAVYNEPEDGIVRPKRSSAAQYVE
jgi:hypothetical protein